jgi:hypothetical protein
MGALGLDITDFVTVGIECTLRQLLEAGFFHAGGPAWMHGLGSSGAPATNQCAQKGGAPPRSACLFTVRGVCLSLHLTS